MGLNQIEHDVVVLAPIARVWAALTQSEQIQRWYAFDGAEVELRPGGALVLQWKEHGTFHGRFLTIDPPNALSFQFASMSPDEEPAEANSTLIQFSLVQEEQSTRVRVVESGFAKLSASEAERSQHAENSRLAWDASFNLLKRLVENP